MKRKYIAIIGLCLLLAACGQKASKTSQSSSNSTSTTITSSSTSSTTIAETSSSTEEVAASSSDETQALATGIQFNGSYYYVQGKYAEIPIVNKKYPLASSYAPGEIPEAKAAFLQLLAAMQAQGFAISTNYSGFRSYEYQASLYQSYVNQDGQVAADTYSARPGYSEHQTGLAFDILDSSGNLLEEPTAAQWLAENAHLYGFVVRYIAGKEAITGYMAETWHIRYIGQEATDIYNSGLTLEEYYGVAGGDYQ